MKKAVMFFVVMFAVVLVSGASLAEEKSITAGGMPVNSGYKGGFFIQNDDGSFKLTFGSTFRLKSYYFKETKTPDNSISFQVRTASLALNSVIMEKAKLGFTLLHSTSSFPTVAGNETFARVQVSSAIASYEVIPEFIVSVGMVGLPLDIDTGRLLTEYPITATQTDGEPKITPLRSSFGAPDGLGINFSGDVWKFSYEAAVVNGNESNYEINPNKKMSAGARLAFNVFDPAGGPSDFAHSETPKFTLNLGTNYQGKRTDPNTGANITYIWTSTFGGRFQWQGFSTTLQGYYRRTKFTSIGTAAWARPRLTDFGYYAGAGYFVIPKKFEVALQAGQVFRQGPDNDSWQMGGGLNYYIFGENFKLQLDYTMTVDFDDITGTRSNKENKAALQLTAKF